jgi:ABC-type multidrug transport system fused ATPase/permease subunit
MVGLTLGRTRSASVHAGTGGTSGAQSGARFYGRILSYFGADRGLIAGLVGLIWISLGAGALEPAVVALLTDSVLSGPPGPNRYTRWLFDLLPESKTGQIVGLAMAWLLLRLVGDVCLMLREMINNRLRYNGTARVRTELFEHLQRLSPAYHRARPQGDALYRLNTDTLGLFGVLNTFIGAANSALTLIVIGAVMLGWNARITVIALTLAPLLVLANVYFSRTIRRTSAASKQADTDFMTFTQRAMASVTLVQLFGRQLSEVGRFREAVDRTIAAGMRMSWQEQLYPLAQRVVYAGCYGFILGYGGYLVYRDQVTGAANPFTVGGVLALTFYLAQLWEPLRRITGFTADVQVNAAAAARVFQVLDVDPTVGDLPGAQPLPLKARTLALEGVVFGYEDDRPPVLRGVSAAIPPGEMVAFVGPSGAGKSTLLNLLPRFYDPDAGAITLDGNDLRTVRLADVRRHVALVPQDSPVVAGTISENIAFGHPTAVDGEVRFAAEQAGAAAFIEELPRGYETEVTENGQNLSGGQRQRLAIARAVLSNAPILVLDEPTSGLDCHHEHKVLETLRRLKGRRTIVLVTHSLHAAAACDRILVLNQGKVAEQGTHEALLALGSVYAGMVAESQRHQQRAEEEEPEAYAG